MFSLILLLYFSCLALQQSRDAKKGNMKKNSSNKGLLIPWLLKSLNEQLYRGLKWSNEQEKIFYILWTHKSAEQWSKDDLEPFKAWAEHKGKLDGKNEKQLKATFRCALNSKKELREVHKTRSRRYWQFVDPDSPEKENDTKKRCKVNSGHVVDIPLADTADNTYVNGACSLRINSSGEAELLASPKLPNFETFCSFASLTPPHQANEISFNISESEISQQKYSPSRESYRLNRDLLDHITSNRVSNVFAKSSSVGSISEECRTSYNSSPDHLKPPVKDLHGTSQFNSFHKLSTDIWQPNCWTTSLAQQDFNNFSHFFSNDFEEIYKSPKHETNNTNRLDSIEMDQFVPVMDISQNDRIANRNAQYNCTNKTVFESNMQDQMKLDDDYLLSDDVDQEACERIMQELNRLTPPSETGLYSYNS